LVCGVPTSAGAFSWDDHTLSCRNARNVSAAYAWLLTDPETSVGSAPLADVPSTLLPQLPRLIRLKYLTEVNRWTTLGPSVARLHDATGGDLSRSRMWAELLCRYDIVDVASSARGRSRGECFFLNTPFRTT